MRKKLPLFLGWVAAGTVVALADWLTGPAFPFAYLFILPVGLAAWHSGRAAGFSMSLVLPALQTGYFLQAWREAYPGAAIAANFAMQVLVLAAFAEVVFRVGSARRFRTHILESAPIGLWIVDSDGQLRLANREGRAIWGGDPMAGGGPRIWRHDTREALDGEARPVMRALRRGESVHEGVFELESPEGGRRIVLGSVVPVRDERGAIEGVVVVNQDITEAKRLEREREDLIKSLEEARQSIKILSGLLPICASCKRIRDEAGAWEQLEWYIRNHSEAEFSHGICPECLRRDYPEFAGSIVPPEPGSKGEGDGRG